MSASVSNGSVNGAANGRQTISPSQELIQEPPTPKPETITYKFQHKLPKLPIPPLEETCKRYLSAVKPLQTASQHKATKAAVKDFLATDGRELNSKLHTYATDKSSYIEEFWYDSYLQFEDSVVLNLNPFFLLEDDPTPNRDDQILRAASLILSTCKFVIALRTETLEPDVFRGIPLDMSQFSRLFGTARLPSDDRCSMKTEDKSRHIVVIAQSQFYWFDVLDEGANAVALSDKEIAANLRAIKKDASQTPVTEVGKSAVGVLTTEHRRVWAHFRDALKSTDPENEKAVDVLDTALFVVCLDHVSPTSPDELAMNMLCGTYEIRQAVQTGTCTNRWYDKLQIIVCENGSAGINFEHTGVDGHTVLRMVSDIYTDTILRFAQTINAATKSLFHSYKPSSKKASSESGYEPDITPKRIEWKLTPEVRAGIKYAETRLSDLILQNEVKVLEFSKYGKEFITSVKLSPDAFVQMAFQAAYYGLYGKCESTYEPAMTKSFIHGRTEAVRTVTTESLEFVRSFCSDQVPAEKISRLRIAIDRHTAITKECSKGLGQDRHLYALECLWKRNHENELRRGEYARRPSIFVDPGWAALNHTVISTSNCGNPALRSFGFGPVVGDGFGIGYIIKEEAISFVISSRHRQTARFMQALELYLLDIKKMLLVERNHSSLASRQYRLQLEEDSMLGGYGYFDAGDLGEWEEKKLEEKERQHKEFLVSGKAVGRRLDIIE